MIGQTQVVIGTEVDHMAAVGNGDIRLLRGGDDAFFLEQPFTASGGKLLFQLLIKRR